MSKDLRKLMRRARKQGWKVCLTGGGHIKWEPPKGDFVMSAQTPSDYRAFYNIRQRLKRAGLKFPR